MKKVLILSNKKNARDSRPFKTEKFYRSYEYFHELGRSRGLEIYSASYSWYDSKRKYFSFAWTFEGERWIKTRKIRPDIIYDKTSFSPEVNAMKEIIASHFKIINIPEFTALLGHKLFSSLLFSKFFKKYYHVKDQDGLSIALKNIPGDKIVLKPPMSCGGEGVVVLKKNACKKIRLSGAILAQEFIDSAGGIREIIKGIHDLRLVFIDRRLIYSYVRTPKRDSFLSNLAQGGKMYYVSVKKLPSSLMPIISEVQKKLDVFQPKIFSIDFMFDRKQKPWVVEFNTMPGFFFFNDAHKKKQKMLFLGIINMLKREIKKAHKA